MLRGSSTDLPGVRELFGRYERASASPAMAAMVMKAATEIDVRKILHTVTTNTLVLARPGDQIVAFEASKALAAAMPNAVFRALPPGAHGDLDIDDSLATETLTFLGGPLSSPTSERVLVDCVVHRHCRFHRTAKQPGRFAVAAPARCPRPVGRSIVVKVRRSTRKAHRRRDLRTIRRSHQGSAMRLRAGTRTCDARNPDPRRYPHR